MKVMLGFDGATLKRSCEIYMRADLPVGIVSQHPWTAHTPQMYRLKRGIVNLSLSYSALMERQTNFATTCVRLSFPLTSLSHLTL
jgi:hypothetical protein